MCFFYSLSEISKRLLKRYQLKLDFEFELAPDHESKYYASGFDYPKMPVITNELPERIQEYRWGLIPAWTKTEFEAMAIRAKTLNARSDTIFEKPSFRTAIRQRRCLIPADGFYEWREFNGKKYPYYIFLKDKEIFSFAGIWEPWIDSATGEVLKTFSIITTEANPLMEKIHNTKKRMPLILPRDLERDWLQNGLSNEAIQGLMKPFDESLMEAYTISKLITSRNSDRNVRAIQEFFKYPELSETN